MRKIRLSTSAALALLSACSNDVRSSMDQFGASGGTFAGAESGSDGTIDGSEDGANSDDALPMKLDLGEPDDPAGECASVTQTTTIDQRPSDVIFVGVGDPIVNGDFDFRWWLSDFPGYLEEEDVSDVEMVLVVEGEASMHIDVGTDGGGQYPSCTDWYCLEEGPAGPAPFDIVDAPIADGRPLRDLLDAAPQWLAHTRPDARKHFMVFSRDNIDETITAAEFVEEGTALHESLEGFKIHALAHTYDHEGIPETGALRVATELTGGLYDDGNLPDVDLGYFPAVIEQIKESSLSCEIEIPEPPRGLIFDREKVNVEYDEGAGLEVIGYVSSASDCATVGAGWHYDDEDNPTKIIMCPYSCGRFSTAGNATVEIQFGCATVPAG